MDIQKELVAEFDREVASTRKVLAAIPADADFSWKPHDKNMAFGRLAGHVAEMPGDWALHTLTLDKLEWTPDMKPYNPANKAEILERYDRDTAISRTALAGLDPAKWDDNWKMVAGDQVWIDGPRYEVFRTWVLNHMIHHRAQLGVYLRLQNLALPGVYGPSADEMPG